MLIGGCFRVLNDKLKKPIHLTPHMLRHTFLKQVTDKYGVNLAQQLSGNVSLRAIFRYTSSLQKMETAKALEELF